MFLDLKKVGGVLLVLNAEQFKEHPHRMIMQRKNENTCVIISRLNKIVSLPILVNQWTDEWDREKEGRKEKR